MAEQFTAPPGVREINRGYLDHIRSGVSGISSLAWWRKVKARVFFDNELRFLLLPILLLLGKLVIFGLRRSAGSQRDGLRSELHRRALNHVDSFVEQYPMHLYPIVAKSFELALLTNYFDQRGVGSTEILEVAIGEGTLSSRLFSNEQRVIGVDLNPYSLVKATKFPHVAKAIVGDGLNPPVRAGAFDLLLSNNFLHHVTQKEVTISNWSRIAERLVFNENTPFWSSGWTVPYLLRNLGLKRLAARRAKQIEEYSLQHLEHTSSLDRYARSSCDIEDEISFMSERTFFFASWFSFFMRCYGPPTPALLKGYFLGSLRNIVIPMTKRLAELLIRFDAYQDRSTDTFVTFICRSKQFNRKPGERVLVCPHCGTLLDDDNRCGRCGRVYSSRDGMLFLLADEFKQVEEEYSSKAAASVPAEQL